ncbi:MAG TPA: tRNA (adenosine(37)-N6)-dimethylallyltransferase MiaA [Aequorivita sp.]|nr:tRNA (adenosine(37)-N6)-dimethylallyltransferase MiaA [Aequorivita sp.]
MKGRKPILICIIGPTAIGKSALAIELAQAFETEIISADSRQFFKEMTIGTAVPSDEELAAVPHHFIQNKSIFEDYSVGDFEREAISLINEKFYPSKKNNNALETLILVGGSGLYVNAVVYGLDDFPEVSPSIRNGLNADFEKHGIGYLQERLKIVDPEYYAKVDLQNPHRVIRALEIYTATGQPFSLFASRKPAIRDFETILIGFDAEREIIYNRINQRVDQMIAQGLVEEARELHKNQHLNALHTVGYRELFSFFDGNLSLEEAIEEIKKNTRRFAKRQNTWFKKNQAVHWFHYQTQTKEIVNFIKEKNAL